MRSVRDPYFLRLHRLQDTCALGLRRLVCGSGLADGVPVVVSAVADSGEEVVMVESNFWTLLSEKHQYYDAVIIGRDDV